MPEEIKINVAVDLGSDTVKTVFAYLVNGKIEYGKLEPPVPQDDALPSLAYYNEDEEKWLFGNDVLRASKKGFKCVVKIKELLSLLIPKVVGEQTINQSNYYHEEKIFPIFYFPQKRDTANLSFAELKERGMTFNSIFTPKQVCEQFFEHLFKNYLLSSIERLKESRKNDLYNAKVTFVSVYPLKAKEEYRTELDRLISRMGYVLTPSISAPKSVGLFAYQEKLIPDRSRALIADIGESDLSVAKIYTLGAGISVDGADAHNEPIELGGNDVDETIREIIEYKVSNREILGKNANDERELFEMGSHYQQFVLMKNIKLNKTFYGLSEQEYQKIFPEGISFNSERDVTVEVLIDKKTLVEGIRENGKNKINGINYGSKSIAERITNYLVSELNRKNNSDVDILILAGGAAMTYGLKSAVETSIREIMKKKFKVISFSDDNRQTVNDEFEIPISEKTIYSASLGAAIYATGKYKVETVAALSYGTWGIKNPSVNNVKSICYVLRKGDKIPEEGGVFLTDKFKTNKVCFAIEGDEFFTTFETIEFPVGDPLSQVRKNAIDRYGLKVIAGKNSKGRILFLKKDRDAFVFVKVDEEFRFKEGVRIDKDGRGKFIAQNVDTRYKYKDVIVKIEGLEDFNLVIEEKEAKKK